MCELRVLVAPHVGRERAEAFAEELRQHDFVGSVSIHRHPASAEPTATSFLIGVMGLNRGPQEARPLIDIAERRGITKEQLRRARERLGIRSLKMSGRNAGHFWFWPSSETSDPHLSREERDTINQEMGLDSFERQWHQRYEARQKD